MSTKKQELLQLQTNAEETIKSDSSENEIVYELIDSTPYTAVQKDGIWYVMLGNKRLNEIELKTRAEVAKFLMDEQYNIMLKTIMIVCDDLIKLNQKQ